MNQRYLWLYVTKDEYELPIAVGSSAADLAKQIGRHPGSIKSSIYHAAKKRQKSCYIKVPYEEDES